VNSKSAIVFYLDTQNSNSKSWSFFVFGSFEEKEKRKEISQKNIKKAIIFK